MRENSLFRLELSGHQTMVFESIIVMFLTGFIASFLGTAAHDVVSASRVGQLGPLPVVAALIVAVLPGLLAALGVYVLVSASEEVLRYEAGLYSSQGVTKSSLIRIWVVLYAAVPSLAYVVGLLGDFALNPGSTLQIELVLPLALSVAVTFFAIVSKTSKILDSSPYTVIRG